jgi:hypothetical protein
MTLNQIVQRVRTLALAHKQIRRFVVGLEGDHFVDHTAKYPACCLEYNAGSISITEGRVTVNFRILLLDLVHVAADTKENQDDVLSDMLSVLMDLVAEMRNSSFSDWRLSADNTISGVVLEHEGDMCAGWYLEFTVSAPFKQNLCEVPTTEIDFTPIDTDMKLIYDLAYVTSGTEGSTITIPGIVGKKVALVIRENAPLHKVSSSPDEAEYIWNDLVLTLGAPVTPGERFLILYRNY